LQDRREYNNQQEWTIRRIGNSLFYAVINNYSSMAIGPAATGNGLVQKTAQAINSQIWKLVYNKDSDAYTFVNRSNNKLLTLEGNNDIIGTNITLDTAKTAAVLFKFSPAKSYHLENVDVPSPSMSKTIPASIILPDNYGDGRRYPVIYVLHGYGGSHTSYLELAPRIRNLADAYQVILVFPDGDVSWYLNSVNDPDKKWMYETFISSELITYVDSHYKTINTRSGRAILGQSMGGQGAFYNAFKHPDLYVAAGSMSGVMSLSVLPGGYNLEDRMGGPNSGATAINWQNNSVINLAKLLTPENAPALYFDCGKQDDLLPLNNWLDETLKERRIPHTYFTREGIHSWYYWNDALPLQFAFLMSYVEAAK
ncbi:MAG: hypothetical protein EOP51_31550, partial [Sphingobacteriales bacterium]